MSKSGDHFRDRICHPLPPSYPPKRNAGHPLIRLLSSCGQNNPRAYRPAHRTPPTHRPYLQRRSQSDRRSRLLLLQANHDLHPPLQSRLVSRQPGTSKMSNLTTNPSPNPVVGTLRDFNQPEPLLWPLIIGNSHQQHKSHQLILRSTELVQLGVQSDESTRRSATPFIALSLLVQPISNILDRCFPRFAVICFFPAILEIRATQHRINRCLSLGTNIRTQRQSWQTLQFVGIRI